MWYAMSYLAGLLTFLIPSLGVSFYMYKNPHKAFRMIRNMSKGKKSA